MGHLPHEINIQYEIKTMFVSKKNVHFIKYFMTQLLNPFFQLDMK